MLNQIKELNENSKQVNIIVQLIAKEEPRYAKGYKITTFIARDPTGQVPIPFWNNEADQVKVGDVIEIQNAYVTSFRNQIQLNIGKFGSYQHIDPPPEFFTSIESVPSIKNSEDEITAIEDLRQVTKKKLYTVKVFVKQKLEERHVKTKFDGKIHLIAVFLVGDASASILLNLWDQQIYLIDLGTSYILHNVYLRTFRKQLFLNLARNGKIKPTVEDVKFNQEKNLSEQLAFSNSM
ncbi:MAG: hypothetical protein ACTSQI_15160 [Candidatus Helarchaeota archaeon]